MPKYMIGSDEQQAYLNDYNWNVKGYSFSNPGLSQQIINFIPLLMSQNHFIKFIRKFLIFLILQPL